MYSVNFVGLNYFNACKEGQKEALIPNGTNGGSQPGDSIPMHNASLFVEADHFDSSNWWPDQIVPHTVKLQVKLGESRTVKMLEFRIPKKEDPEKKGIDLNFRCTPKFALQNRNLDMGLPNLSSIDGFVLDPDPDTIANIALPTGDLEVFQFGSAALVRWLISNHQEPITITAVDGDEKRRITLKKSDPEIPTEIVFSNTVDLFPKTQDGGQAKQPAANAPVPRMPDGMPTGGMPPADIPSGGMPTGGMDGHQAAGVNGAAMPGMGGMGGMSMPGSGHGFAGHFMLYAKLDKDRNKSLFEKPNLPDFTGLTPLPFSHPYLAFLSDMDEVPDGACVPSCC